jgi:hypothetical protein
MEPLVFSSDLVQIETDPAKAAAARSEPETPSAPRPPRVRPRLPPVADEPLVQIETRK